MSNNKLHAIGIMSGTSLDGIDVSYVSSDGKSIFTHNSSSLFKFRDSTRKSLHNLVNNFTKNKNSISNIRDCENLVSEDYVNAIRKFIKSKNIKKLILLRYMVKQFFILQILNRRYSYVTANISQKKQRNLS